MSDLGLVGVRPLRSLVGTCLADTQRALDMEMFRFTAIVPGSDRKDLWLHVQASWTLRCKGEVVARYGDVVRAPSGAEGKWADVAGGGESLRDERLEAFLRERPPEARIVVRCSQRAKGGFRLAFSDGCALTVAGTKGTADGEVELWRLLRYSTHYVMTSAGLTAVSPEGPRA